MFEETRKDIKIPFKLLRPIPALKRNYSDPKVRFFKEKNDTRVGK